MKLSYEAGLYISLTIINVLIFLYLFITNYILNKSIKKGEHNTKEQDEARLKEFKEATEEFKRSFNESITKYKS